MKKLILFAMVGIVFAACNKNDEPYKFQTDLLLDIDFIERPNCKYSVSEIVRDSMVQLVNSYGMRGFSDAQRDTVNNRLLMWGTDILLMDGTLSYDFIGATDVHLIIPNGLRDEYGLRMYDTCGYIPNSVLASARAQIEELYAQERYDEIYELFRKAYTFYTCTGEEYKEIVKAEKK